MKEAVEVHNLDTQVYSEKLGDDLITIPANGKTVMGRRDAIKFLGQHAGMDAKTGLPRKKNLVIEAIAGKPVEVAKKFICPLEGLEFSAQGELDDHVRLVHPGQQFKDERVEKVLEEKAIPVGSVACPFCGHIVKNKAGLKIHLASCKANEAA